MSLERYTVSSRRLLALGFLVALLAGAASGLVVARQPLLAAANGQAAEPAGDEVVGDEVDAAADEPDGGDADAADERQGSNGGQGGHEPDSDLPPIAAAAEEPLAIPEDDLVAAQQVAADFAAGYTTYRWDDPPGAMLSRVSGLVTRELADLLARAEGGSSGREELAARREEAIGVVEAVQPQTATPEWVDLLVVVRQEITTSEGTDARWVSYLTRVAPTSDGWRVAAFQP